MPKALHDGLRVPALGDQQPGTRVAVVRKIRVLLTAHSYLSRPTLEANSTRYVRGS